jgi:hypothetical protein
MIAKYLLFVLLILLLAAMAALSVDHVMKSASAVYRQYDQEVGMQ